MNNRNFLSRSNGEIVYKKIDKKRDNPDTVLFHQYTPIILMLILFMADVAVLSNLFGSISTDLVILDILPVTVMIFCIDLVPGYLGILFQKIKENYKKDIVVIAGLAIWIAALITIIVLRVVGFVVEDKGTIFSVIFGSVIPILTSTMTFFITYTVYKPGIAKLLKLKNNKRKLEDRIRRTSAIIDELESLDLSRISDFDKVDFEQKDNQLESEAIQTAAIIRELIAKKCQSTPEGLDILLDIKNLDEFKRRLTIRKDKLELEKEGN